METSSEKKALKKVFFILVTKIVINKFLNKKKIHIKKIPHTGEKESQLMLIVAPIPQ